MIVYEEEYWQLVWNTYINITVIVGLYKNDLLNIALNIFIHSPKKQKQMSNRIYKLPGQKKRVTNRSFHPHVLWGQFQIFLPVISRPVEARIIINKQYHI